MLRTTGIAAALAMLALAVSAADSAQVASAAAIPATYRVAADGSAEFRTIQDAVDAAASGDIVLVGPGTYTESIVIDKDLDVVGDGPREAVVLAAPADVSPEGSVPGSGRPYAIWLTGETVTISHLTVATADGTAGVVSTAGAPLIERVSFVGSAETVTRTRAGTHRPFDSMGFFGETRPTVRDCEWDGYVAVREGASATFVGNTIRGDTISIDGPGESSVRDSVFHRGSISMSWGVSGVIEGNEFSGDISQVGVDTGSTVEIRGNRFSGSMEDAAIWIEGRDANAVVSGNTVEDSITAVRISGGGTVSVEANTLEATSVGIAVSGTDAAIEGNTIMSEGAGIAMGFGASPTITGNTIDAGGHAITVGPASAPAVTGNVVCGRDESIYVADGATPEISDNEICGQAPSE